MGNNQAHLLCWYKDDTFIDNNSVTDSRASSETGRFLL